MRTYEPGLGESIAKTARKMVLLTTMDPEPVTATFNDIELQANSHTTEDEIVGAYTKECERRSKEYEASLEGKAAALRSEEFHKRATAAEAEGIKPFALKDADEWTKSVALNTDGYSSCCIRYAARWAWMMEQVIGSHTGEEAAKIIQQIAKDTGRSADLEGVSGFMYGCAVNMLARCWVHGEALRKWHNLDSQFGTEGEQANESGGVLNPALLILKVE